MDLRFQQNIFFRVPDDSLSCELDGETFSRLLQHSTHTSSKVVAALQTHGEMMSPEQQFSLVHTMLDTTREDTNRALYSVLVGACASINWAVYYSLKERL